MVDFLKDLLEGGLTIALFQQHASIPLACTTEVPEICVLPESDILAIGLIQEKSCIRQDQHKAGSVRLFTRY